MFVRFIIKFVGKIFQDVIISVFSKNVCTQICYNGRGWANSLVLISLGWFLCLPSFLRQGCSATHFAATQAMRPVLTLPVRLFHGPTHATSGGYFLLLRNEAIRHVEQTICPGIDLLPPKYSTNMQIRTYKLSEKWFITEITALLITRWHK